MLNWHTLSTALVLEELETKNSGLNQEEIIKRFKVYGPNKLVENKPPSLFSIFFSQFKSPLIYLLFVAGIIVVMLNEKTDGLVIFGVLFFNALIGTFQEGRAQNTLRALKSFVETKATVVRDSHEILVNDFELVPGDIVVLNEGDKVPADMRLLQINNLRINEASLTGESEPVPKTDEVLTKEILPVAEQKNMVFKGTNVVAGLARAVVTATGSRTEIGKISQEIAGVETDSPLKADIDFLSKIIIAGVLGLSLLLLLIGVSLGRTLIEMVSTTVALAISIIPEGLPVAMTMVLATGVWRSAKRNVLVKKMQAVEALGQAQIVAVDKTGTITKNEMVVRKIYVENKAYEITGNGYEPKGDVIQNSQIFSNDSLTKGLKLIAQVASLASNAQIFLDESSNEWKIIGDPSDAALSAFAGKLGFDNVGMKNQYPRIGEIPFDYKTKYHAVMHQDKDRVFVCVVGAPEVILAKSSLKELEKKELEQIYDDFSKNGLRILALAYLEQDRFQLTTTGLRNLNFIGFVGIQDTLRPEVREALRKTEEAGMRVVMITGDHKVTAQAIATQAGIYKPGDLVLTGEELESMPESKLLEKLKSVSVFARVTPEHKFKIINAYKKLGLVVAMTGDGVNDAPSLVAADLGVAMGKIGTEVAKEAADIVLLDDNFGSIAAAVEEGRSIYITIKKVILYLFSTGMGELLTIAVAIILSYPLPVLPSQIIWLNFVTDGFLVVALAMEPKEANLLKTKFGKQKRHLLDITMAERMLGMATVMCLGSILVFKDYLGGDLIKAQTMALTTLAVFQWFNAWNCRSDKKSIFGMNPFSNMYLIVATIIVVLLQLAAVYLPFMQNLLHTTPLAWNEWFLILTVSVSIIAAEEFRKLLVKILKKSAI